MGESGFLLEHMDQGVRRRRRKGAKFWDDLTECLEGFRKKDKSVLLEALNDNVGNLPVHRVVRGCFEFRVLTRMEKNSTTVW